MQRLTGPDLLRSGRQEPRKLRRAVQKSNQLTTSPSTWVRRSVERSTGYARTWAATRWPTSAPRDPLGPPALAPRTGRHRPGQCRAWSMWLHVGRLGQDTVFGSVSSLPSEEIASRTSFPCPPCARERQYTRTYDGRSMEGLPAPMVQSASIPSPRLWTTTPEAVPWQLRPLPPNPQAPEGVVEMPTAGRPAAYKNWHDGC